MGIKVRDWERCMLFWEVVWNSGRGIKGAVGGNSILCHSGYIAIRARDWERYLFGCEAVWNIGRGVIGGAERYMFWVNIT